MAEPVSPYLPQLLNELAAKRFMLIDESHKVKVVALGSSHGANGFNPKIIPYSFNLCCQSQDIKHSFYLYEKVFATCPSLTTVVIFYSYFSSGFVLERSTSERYVAAAINEIFQLGLTYTQPDLINLTDLLRGKLNTFRGTLSGDHGVISDYSVKFFPESYGVARRVSEHSRFSTGIDGLFYLLRIALMASNLQHKLIVVIPPARRDYIEAVKKVSATPFESLYSTFTRHSLFKDLKILDLFEHSAFNESHFGDFDHLIPSDAGAIQLSQFIQQSIFS